MTDDPRLKTRALIWDLPTRLFHWLLVGGFVVVSLTAANDERMSLHLVAGYLIGVLVLFRVLWGFVGGDYSRFRRFWYPWREVRAHLRAVAGGRAVHHLGHNPAGGWMIYLLLAGNLVLAVSGTLLLGGEEQHGLAGALGPAAGAVARELHAVLGYGLMALIPLHVAGVVVESRLGGENLVAAMISGYKSTPKPALSVRPAAGVAVGLLIVVAGYFAAATVWYRAGESEGGVFRGPSLPQSALWNDTCGECHLAFHPSLLPRRSWERLLGNSADHFGEDLALDAQDLAELRRFAVANSAETGASEPARKILRSLGPDQRPLRITETPYWRRKHEGIDAAVWKRDSVGGPMNCGACHSDARQGWFEDDAMQIPTAESNANSSK